jgi:hypothetical protein
MRGALIVCIGVILASTGCSIGRQYGGYGKASAHIGFPMLRDNATHVLREQNFGHGAKIACDEPDGPEVGCDVEGISGYIVKGGNQWEYLRVEITGLSYERNIDYAIAIHSFLSGGAKYTSERRREKPMGDECIGSLDNLARTIQRTLKEMDKEQKIMRQTVHGRYE